MLWQAAILFLAGIAVVIWPAVPWFLFHGWKYENAEPSEFALIVYRVGGIVCSIVFVIVFFTLFGSS